MNKNKKTMRKKILGWTLGTMGILGTTATVVGASCFGVSAQNVQTQIQKLRTMQNDASGFDFKGNELIEAPTNIIFDLAKDLRGSRWYQLNRNNDLLSINDNKLNSLPSDAELVYSKQELSSAQQRQKNLYVDLSKLISVSADKLYNEQGFIFRDTPPQIKIQWNSELIRALYEASAISDLLVQNLLGQNGEKFTKWWKAYDNSVRSNVCYLIEDIYNGRVNTKKINEYINSLGTEFDTTAPNYTFSPNDAQYYVLLKEAGFINSNNKIKVTESNVASVLEQILNRGFIWKYTLPMIFKNNSVYVTTEQSAYGTNVPTRTTHVVLDHKRLVTGDEWVKISPKDMGNQRETHSNKINYKLIDIGISNAVSGGNNVVVNNTTGIGKNGVNNNTLNFENLARNVQQPKSARSSERNYKLTSDKNLEFEFMYNTLNYWSEDDERNPAINGFPTVMWDELASNLAVKGFFSSYEHYTKLEKEINRCLSIPDQAAKEYGFNKPGDWILEASWFSYSDIQLVEKLNPNLSEKALNNLKNFGKIKDRYTIASMRDYENDPVYWKDYLKAKYELDNLGYFYLTIETKIDLEYYYQISNSKDMKRIMDDEGYILPICYADKTISPFHNYAIRIDCKKKPLDINKLDRYIKVSRNTTTKEAEQINETLNKFDSKVDLVDRYLSDVSTTSAAIQNQMKNYNAEVSRAEKLMNNVLNQNSEYQQQLNNVQNLIDKQIETIRKQYDKQWNPSGSLNGFNNVINVDFNLENEINQLIKYLDLKIELMNQYYSEAKNKISFDWTILNSYKNTLVRLENNSNEIINKINNLVEQLNAIVPELDSYNSLTGQNNIKVEFDIDAMKADANWDWDVPSELNPDNFYDKTSTMIKDGTFFSKMFYIPNIEAVEKFNQIFKAYGFDVKLPANIFDKKKQSEIDPNSNFVLVEQVQEDGSKKLVPTINNISDFSVSNNTRANIENQTPEQIFNVIKNTKINIQKSVEQLETNKASLSKQAQELNIINSMPDVALSVQPIQDVQKAKQIALSIKDQQYTKYETEVSVGAVAGTATAGVLVIVAILLIVFRHKFKKGTKIVKASKSEEQHISDMNKALSTN